MNKDTTFISSVDCAYSIIKEKILSGELKPGERLSKRRMAELAGTSVSPVITALYKLEEDGLVENKERWGSRVAVLDRKGIQDLYMLRLAIECQVVHILSKKMTEIEYQECFEIAHKLDNSKYYNTELNEISALHVEFHMKLAEKAGYPSLIQALERSNLRWILCNADKRAKELRELPENWHKKVLDAIMTHNGEEAERVMREHINDSFKDII